MNAEISIVQNRFLKLFTDQQAYLAGKPTQFLLDLQHEASDLRHHVEFSVRAAAEINLAACTLLLEKRPMTGHNPQTKGIK